MKYVKPRTISAVSVAVGIGAGIFGIAGMSQAGDSPPAGLAMGVSALSHAPRVTGTMPADMPLFARANAPTIGVTPQDLVASARLLRTDLGLHHRSVYGFRIKDTICFLLTGEGGTCSNGDGSSSLTWTIGGGDGVTDAGALVGIAADDVSSIGLTVDGSAIPVSLANNVAYADLPLHGNIAVISVTHSDGKVTSDTVHLQG